jgi:hypothetical protein
LWCSGTNVTEGRASQWGKVSVKEAGEAEVTVQATMVRVESMVEGLGAAGLDQRSDIGCHQDEIKAKGTP